MQTETITIDREEAAKAWRKYREHLGAWDLTEVERAAMAGRIVPR